MPVPEVNQIEEIDGTSMYSSLACSPEADHLEANRRTFQVLNRNRMVIGRLRGGISQRERQRGEIGRPPEAMPRPCHEGNSRGRQASMIERIGARLGPPRCFANTAVGHPSSVAPPSPSGPFRK